MIFRDCNILQLRHESFFFGLQNPFLGVQNISPEILRFRILQRLLNGKMKILFGITLVYLVRHLPQNFEIMSPIPTCTSH
jgi:hypothetical protein